MENVCEIHRFRRFIVILLWTFVDLSQQKSTIKSTNEVPTSLALAGRLGWGTLAGASFVDFIVDFC